MISKLYPILSRFFPTCPAPKNPSRIVIIRPCCIGDVVMATAVLAALRQHYPNAHITWAVGGWSVDVVRGHPLLDEILETGKVAHAVATVSGFLQFVKKLRAGHYDLAVSLVRSPKMSLAVAVAGVPYRAGIDSRGRGFAYNIRSPLNPTDRRHEVDIFLDVVRALAVNTQQVFPTVPILPATSADVMRILSERAITGRFLVVNPSGGSNPGTRMDEKRYPPAQLAHLVNLVGAELKIESVLIVAGPGDERLAEAFAERLRDIAVHYFVGSLTFQQIGALALLAQAYIGNDTGLTHLAAAAGAKTVMILGPTDPQRYRAYSPNAIYLWKPIDTLPAQGAKAGAPRHWDWERDGVSPTDAAPEVIRFLGGSYYNREPMPDI